MILNVKLVVSLLDTFEEPPCSVAGTYSERDDILEDGIVHDTIFRDIL